MRLLRAFRDVLADLSGRSQSELVDSLTGQVDAAIEAVLLAREATDGRVSTGQARTRMGELEDTGDRYRYEVVMRLSRTLVTPIDREDLFRLSRSIDDVLDNLRDFARELDLFGFDVGSELLHPSLDAIGGALGEMRDAVVVLASNPDQASQGSLRTKKLVNEIRSAYQIGLAELFEAEFDDHTLKRRELLRRLDVVGLRIGAAADALADGGLTRGA